MNILGSQSPLHPSTLSTGKFWWFVTIVSEASVGKEKVHFIQTQSAAMYYECLGVKYNPY